MPRRTDPTELTQRSLRSDRTNRGKRSVDSSTLPVPAAMPGGTTILPQPEEHEVRANRTAQSGRRHFGHSPEQVGNMIASCLPSDKVILFKRTLRSECKKFREGNGAFSTCPGRTRLGYLSKCPVECIEEALKICFAGYAVLITRLSSVDEYEPAGGVGAGCGDFLDSSSSWLQFYVMDCILNRSLRPPRKETQSKVANNNIVGSSNMTSVPLKISFTGGDTTSTEERCYRAVVAAIPDAGIFYSSHERRSALVPQDKEAMGNNSGVKGEPFYGDRPYLPMDIAWLRVRCRDCLESVANKKGVVDGESYSWFRRGGYVEHLFDSGVEDDLMPRIWKIAIGVPPARRGTNVVDAAQHRAVFPQMHSILQAYHAPDGYGIPLPPDVFLETTEQDGNKEETVVVRNNVCDARVYYRKQLRLSSSSKKRCRHYVNGALHEVIPPGSYIVRPQVDGPLDIVVSVQAARPYTSATGLPEPGCLPDAKKFDFMDASDYLPIVLGNVNYPPRRKRKRGVSSPRVTKEMNACTSSDVDYNMHKDVTGSVVACDGKLKYMKWYTERQTVVKVRFVGVDRKFSGPLRAMTDLGKKLQNKGKAHSRVGCGDQGHMYAIGSRVVHDKEAHTSTCVPYAGNSAAGSTLPPAVQAMEKIGLSLFPSVLRSMQSAERMYGLNACDGMEKVCKTRRRYADNNERCKDNRVSRIALTLDCSNNLSNSSHYDVNDGSAGYAVWTELIPGLASNWYFILPNIYGETKEGKPFSGLAIQLSHGVAIQWDGRILRHCTSVFQSDGVNSSSNIGKPLVPPENQVYGMFSAAKTKLVDFARTTFASGVADRLRLEELSRLLDENNVSSASTTRSGNSTGCVLGGTIGVDTPAVPVSDDVGHILVDNNTPSSTVSLLVDSMTIPRKKSKIESRVACVLEGKDACPSGGPDVGRPCCHEWYNRPTTTTNPMTTNRFVDNNRQQDDNSRRGNYDDRSMIYGQSVQFAQDAGHRNEWNNRRTRNLTTTNRFVDNREQYTNSRRGNDDDRSLIYGPSAQSAHGRRRTNEWYNRPTRTTNQFVVNKIVGTKINHSK